MSTRSADRPRRLPPPAITAGPARPEDFHAIRPKEMPLPGATPADLVAALQNPLQEVWCFRQGARPLAIFGLWHWLPNMAFVWALVDARIRPRQMFIVTQTLRNWLEDCPLRRIEATVRVDFQPGINWLEALGLVREGRMTAFGVDGGDHWRYAWVSPREIPIQES